MQQNQEPVRWLGGAAVAARRWTRTGASGMMRPMRQGAAPDRRTGCRSTLKESGGLELRVAGWVGVRANVRGGLPMTWVARQYIEEVKDSLQEAFAKKDCCPVTWTRTSSTTATATPCCAAHHSLQQEGTLSETQTVQDQYDAYKAANEMFMKAVMTEYQRGTSFGSTTTPDAAAAAPQEEVPEEGLVPTHPLPEQRDLPDAAAEDDI